MLFNKLCVVNKKDDSMWYAAVMSGSRVLEQRVWPVTASVYKCCFHRIKSHTADDKSLQKQSIIKQLFLLSLLATVNSCLQRSRS